MLYLIGLGLDVKGISLQGLEATKKCKKIYLENYTVDFPYSLKELEKSIERKIIPSDRNFVENGIEDLVKEAKKENVALLVYGSPLTATTHMSLIQEAKEQKDKVRAQLHQTLQEALLSKELKRLRDSASIEVINPVFRTPGA